MLPIMRVCKKASMKNLSANLGNGVTNQSRMLEVGGILMTWI